MATSRDGPHLVCQAIRDELEMSGSLATQSGVVLP